MTAKEVMTMIMIRNVRGLRRRRGRPWLSRRRHLRKPVTLSRCRASRGLCQTELQVLRHTSKHFTQQGRPHQLHARRPAVRLPWFLSVLATIGQSGQSVKWGMFGSGAVGAAGGGSGVRAPGPPCCQRLRLPQGTSTFTATDPGTLRGSRPPACPNSVVAEGAEVATRNSHPSRHGADATVKSSLLAAGLQMCSAVDRERSARAALRGVVPFTAKTQGAPAPASSACAPSRAAGNS